MGYQQTGFIKVPRALVLTEAAETIAKEFKTDLDREVARAIKTLGKSDNIRLSNFNFERLLTIEHVRFDANAKLKIAFLTLLADFLHETGYIDVSPIVADYNVDPVMQLEEVIEAILATRMPKFTATDMGGEFATIDTLAYWMPEVIRRLLLINNERTNCIDRFRRWIGSLGFKLLKGEALAQAERTAFVMYSSTRQGTPGWYPGLESTPIRAIETGDVLVNEVGALYKAVTLAGPFTNHLKMISDQVRERLTFYLGLHTPELKMCRGSVRPYGPFEVYDLQPVETIPWSLEDQLTGITGVSAYFGGSKPASTAFSIHVPLMVAERNENGIVGVFPDDPGYRLILTNQGDVSDYEIEYLSKQRQRVINSRVNNATQELAIADAAFERKTLGACSVAATTLQDFGLMTLTDRSSKKVSTYENDRIFETYLLPGPTGVRLVDVDVTAMSVLWGSIEALPAFAEFVQPPLKVFREPAPRVVEYVSAVVGLSLDERRRFEDVISIYHNCAKFKRMTGREAPIDQQQLAFALLRIPSSTTLR